MFNWDRTFATGEKGRTQPPNKALPCIACLQEGKGSNNKSNTALRKITLVTHFTSCCPMTTAFCTCVWSLKFVSSFYMVSHKTPPKQRWQQRRKVQQEQNKAKGRANRQVRARMNSRKGEPERERRQQRDSRGQVAWREMSHFSLLHKQLFFYFYILLIKVERQPWDTQSCQK